jgi:NDP-sugar pyrophosphorylase family protein
VQVAVLCGGKGTRLGEPIKCLAEVAGRPFMDWKIEQLERLGATDIRLVCGPFLSEFAARYGQRCTYQPDPQTGISDALGFWSGWWTWGDTLLEQKPEGENVCYVVPGVHIAGLWLDAGLYHGQGPWQLVETNARPRQINTPTDLARCSETLLRYGLTGGH